MLFRDWLDSICLIVTRVTLTSPIQLIVFLVELQRISESAFLPTALVKSKTGGETAGPSHINRTVATYAKIHNMIHINYQLPNKIQKPFL